MVSILVLPGESLKLTLPENLCRELAPKQGEGLLVTRNNLALHSTLQATFPALRWQVVTKEDMRGRGLRHLLAFIRKRPWSVVAVEDGDSEIKRRHDLYTMILLAARTQSRWILATGTSGTVTAHPLAPGRGFTQVLGAFAAELFTSIRAIVSAYVITWKMRNADPRAASGGEPAVRVAMVKTQFWFGVQAGGSVSHVRGVASGMRALGLLPHLWTTSRIPAPESALPQTEVPPDERPRIVEDAAMAGFNRTFLRKAGDEIARFRPSFIYQRHDIFNVCGLVLARRLGVPLVLEVNASEVWAREAWSRLFLKRLARRMERIAFQNADRLVLITEELVPTVLGLGGSKDRIVICPNGVEVERFDPGSDTRSAKAELGFPDDGILCGFLGTFARWHGVLFLAEQIPVLLADDSRFRFLFIGEGDMRPEVERRLSEAGVQQHAGFTGLLPPERVPRHLAACDILLSPHLPFEDGTEFFGSPTKLFEYMAAGRAIVASRLGSIARVLADGETGMLIEPGDGVALRATLIRLADHPEERLRLGRNARTEAERSYTWTANVRRALEGVVSLPAL